MELPVTWSAPLSPPPPFSDGGVAHNDDERISQRIDENNNNVNANHEHENGYNDNNDDEEAPAYSYYPSAEGSPFELKTIGKSPLNIKEKYLCGDLLDNRYFLLGTTSGLEFIDLSTKTTTTNDSTTTTSSDNDNNNNNNNNQDQVPKKLIEFVRFKKIKIFEVPRYSALLALAGKNNHVRVYDLNSIRLLIKSKLDQPKQPSPPPPPSQQQKLSTLRSNLLSNTINNNDDKKLYSFHGRSKSMDSIFDDPESSHLSTPGLSLNDLNLNLSLSNSSSPNLSLPSTTITNLARNSINLSESRNIRHTNLRNFSHSSSSSSSSSLGHNQVPHNNNNNNNDNNNNNNYNNYNNNHPHHQIQNNKNLLSLNYSKLPKTKMALSFTIGSGPTRSFLAVLSKQNIFLFRLEFDEINRDFEFELIRTYWLPQTPKFLKMSMYEDQLLNIIAVFDNDVILVGVDDARIRDVLLDSNLRSNNSHTFISSLICDSPSWRTFSQLSWVPNFDPEFLSDSFTIPPPYSLIVNEDPSKMLNPISIFDSNNNSNSSSICLSSSYLPPPSPSSLSLSSPFSSSPSTNLPSLFFATFGSKSMIVDEKGRPFCTIIYKWSLPPIHVEFINPKDKKNGEGFVVGFGKNMVEVRSLNTGRLVENVVRGVDVQFLGRGEGLDLIWGCYLNKGSKRTCFYRLRGPRI
ncbi:hypothetical protein Glove_461g64 [Diversispora epigaea]|uniref:CNH domain-containing protein n=1 Tax=Diversispora epigaea TaxID=1348612 RepID=A0A397GSG6_9GLOM|nr:hypothetical protein Glove_461g64 [Diversispora epigaea]